jgi:hypothetical protein
MGCYRQLSLEPARLGIHTGQCQDGALYGRAGFLEAIRDDSGLASCFLSLRFVRPRERAFHRR